MSEPADTAAGRHAHGEATAAPGPAPDVKPLLTVQDLVVDFRLNRHVTFRALDKVSLDIKPGECVGLVGESGSGKSTLGKAVLGLVPIAGGTVEFRGRDITRARGSARRRLASDLQVVFQDPYGSLDPAMTIGQILAEPLRVAGVGKAEAAKRVAHMLDQVSMPAGTVHRYPSEFSGGQRQRIAIARALVREPKLVICDEPVSALDLTTQASIMDLFIDIQRETGVSYLFVSHDLSVVRYICHRVSVMHDGHIVESGDSRVVTRTPEDPYTQNLLLASPVANPAEQAQRRERWLSLRQPVLAG